MGGTSHTEPLVGLEQRRRAEAYCASAAAAGELGWQAKRGASFDGRRPWWVGWGRQRGRAVARAAAAAACVTRLEAAMVACLPLRNGARDLSERGV